MRKDYKEHPDVPVPMRRRGISRDLRSSGVATAAELIGRLATGDEISGLTNGQFSLIDVIEHILSQTGPADVTVATWTMGIHDEERAAAFCRDGRIERMRWIVDPSFFSRRPELAGRLVEAFGPASFRPVNSHAKWATIRGAALAVVIRSSMNLNPNRRIESFDISCCEALTAYFERIVDAIFEVRPEHHGGRATQSEAVFDEILAIYEQHKKQAPFGGQKMRAAKGWRPGAGAA